jgi:hypothetical protein
VFLLNSRLGLFVATSTVLSHRWYPFSRSYGAILPSSLTDVISTPENSHLAYLCRFPVRSLFCSLEVFLVSGGSTKYIFSFRIDAPIMSQFITLGRIFQFPTTSNTSTGNPFSSSIYLSASPHHSNAKSGAGIFNLLSIAYSNWPRLRYRLTLSG